MKIIEIEDVVFQALEKLVRGFDEKPNDVIKRLISSANPAPSPVNATNGANAGGKAHPVVEFVQSPEYLSCDAKGRYFGVLRFLCQNHPQEFAKLDGYKKGKRVQISKDPAVIERSGRSTNPQRLEGTPYWVLSNLGNLRKRSILEDVLRYFHFPNEIVDPVLRSIPDSGISRSKRIEVY